MVGAMARSASKTTAPALGKTFVQKSWDLFFTARAPNAGTGFIIGLPAANGATDDA
jgi:hypothetical protein